MLVQLSEKKYRNAHTAGRNIAEDIFDGIAQQLLARIKAVNELS